MKKLSLSLLILFPLLFLNNAYAQFGEPEVEEKIQPRSLYDEGFRTGFGFHFTLNDFGFGAGGQFRFGLSDYTEAIITLKASALKDPTEQTFIDYYFGGRIIPSKYKRAVSVPLYFGLKKRFFAREISDNFRLFGSLSAGPVFAWTTPYFQDFNENGFRENDANIYGFVEPVYDIFQGWDASETHWGAGGELVIGIDFGDNFANLSSVQFGYTMNYFQNGIQIMQPFKADLNNITPILDDNGNPVRYEYDVIPANDRRKYFGSAQISFVFGWMW